MLAALYSRRHERAREIGLWRTLGASRRTLRAALASEVALLGLLAGLVAALGAILWREIGAVFRQRHIAGLHLALAEACVAFSYSTSRG